MIRAHVWRTTWRWMPAAVIALAVVTDLLTHRWVSTAPLLAVAPVMTAFTPTWINIVATGAAAIAAHVYLGWVNGTLFTRGDVVVELQLAAITVLAVGLNHYWQMQRAFAGRAQETARVAQEAVLPRPPQQLCGVRVAVRYVPADDVALIGGDLYVAQETPYGIRAMIADVRGKGLSAVAAVSADLGAFRHLADHCPDLPSLAEAMEKALAREGERHGGLDQTEGFTTALLIELPTDLEYVRLLNRGHPAPLLLEPGLSAEPLQPTVEAPPLGLTGLGPWTAPVSTFRFPPGAILLCFTDGVTEARNHAGIFYDAPTRISRMLTAQRSNTGTEPAPEQVLDFLARDVLRHSAGPPQDDQALMALKRPAMPMWEAGRDKDAA